MILKKVNHALLYVFLCILLIGCGNTSAAFSVQDGKAIIPWSSNSIKHEYYEAVMKQLKEAGFSSITTVVLYDQNFGWQKEGKVESVTFGNMTEYQRGDATSIEEDVVVTYHMPSDADPEKRTYQGVVYDHVIHRTAKDGLRAKTEVYYFFCESEKKVLHISRSSAGGGKTRKSIGTYEGSLDDVVVTTFSSGKYSPVFQKYETDETTYWHDDYLSCSYREADIISAIKIIKGWH